MADCNISEEMKHCYENLIVIDAGANLTNKKYSRDLDSVIQRAKDSGIICVILIIRNKKVKSKYA